MELSIDILREILKRVSLDDFGQLRQVSKQFNELCSREIKCRVSRRLESGAAFMTLNTQLPQDQYTEFLEEVANNFPFISGYIRACADRGKDDHILARPRKPTTKYCRGRTWHL